MMPEFLSHLRLTGRGAVLWRRVVMLAIAGGLLLTAYWPALAAIELMYFKAESTNTSVLLSWATAREIDVEGFLILCKRDGEPDSAYHFIGQRAAMGGPSQAAEYTFAVTENVYYGEQYCFRLEEVTTNDEPGEKRDICGYGPGVTPTPAVDSTIVGVVASLTPIVVTPVPGQSPAPTLVTPGASPTWTPIGQSPIATSTADPFATASSTQFGSPIGTPTATQDASAAGLTATPFESPSPTPSVTTTGTATPTSTQMVSPQGTPTVLASDFLTGTSTATSTVPPTTTSTTPTGSPAGATGSGDGAVANLPATEAGGIQPTPTPLYIVVTATPTPEALAVAPTLTPLPTATMTSDLGLFNVLAPSTQSMMVMMLCLIFLSATGLGTLGLVTAILYFRSESQSRTDGRDYIDRRRF